MSASLAAKSKLPAPSPQLVQKALESAEGILRLAPTWVPRSFLMPGKRIKLHPKQIYAYGLITMQGFGKIGKHPLETPAMIRLGELTSDEYFVTHDAATGGVTFENTGTEPLVTLRYSGPGVNPHAPAVGDHKKHK